MKKFEHPFVHYAFQNFLNEKLYERALSAYSNFELFEKDSDLFHFNQTNELADEPSIQFFKKELDRVFKSLSSLQDSYYNIFGSLYNKGDYLLCHDDVVDDRKYAFIYYLVDHPSAELVLYDDTATKIVKKVKVRKNLLAIFQVSNISYHEVAMSKHDGRKALTGWFNVKGQGALRPKKEIPPYQPIVPKEVTKFKLEQDIDSQEYYTFPGLQYVFDIVSRSVTNPFYERKATRLELSQYVVLDLKGYSLYSAEFFLFKKGDYLLLNDPVNMLGEGILDVFILQLPNGGSSINSFISVIDEHGKKEGDIPYMNDHMFIIHRGKKNYYIDIVEEDVYLGHLMYRKNKDKHKTAKAVEVKQGKDLRAKFIQGIKEMKEVEVEEKKKPAQKKKHIRKEDKNSNKQLQKKHQKNKGRRQK